MFSNLLPQLSRIAWFRYADADASAHSLVRIEDGAGEKDCPDNRLFIIDGISLSSDLLPLLFDLGFFGERPGRLLFRLEVFQERGLARMRKKSRHSLPGSRRVEMTLGAQRPDEAEVAPRLLHVNEDSPVAAQHGQIGALVKSLHHLAQIRSSHLDQPASAVQTARQRHHLHSQPVRPAGALLLHVTMFLEAVENPVRRAFNIARAISQFLQTQALRLVAQRLQQFDDFPDQFDVVILRHRFYSAESVLASRICRSSKKVKQTRRSGVLEIFIIGTVPRA